MKITIESINEKLGFDFRTWKNPYEGLFIHDDNQNNPFNILSCEESRFIIDYYSKEENIS